MHYPCFLAALTAGKASWCMLAAGLFEPGLVLSSEDVMMMITPPKCRWVLTHYRLGKKNKRSNETGPMSYVWRWVPEREGVRERRRGVIWAARRAEKPKLSQKFLAEPPPSFTDFVSQQQWAAGLTLWVVKSLGWAVSLAGWTEGIAG